MYSMKKVSEMLGLPAVTIRAWENRYGIVSPARSEGGHRLYSPEDIRTLQWLKEQTVSGRMKISEAIRLLEQSGPSIIDTFEPAPSETAAPSAPFSRWIEQVYGKLTGFRAAEAHEIVDLAMSVCDYEDVFHQLLTPVMIRIGDEWEAGIVSELQEHYATDFMLLRFHAVLRVMPAPYLNRKAVLFCPEGELHQLGLMLFGLFLRRRGIDIIYLGPNTPLRGMIELIRENGVTIAAISATGTGYAAAIKRWLPEALRACPGLIPVLGGQGFAGGDHSLAPYIIADSLSDWEQWLLSRYTRRASQV